MYVSAGFVLVVILILLLIWIL